MNRDLFVLGKKSEKKHHDHLDLCFHEGEKVLVENLFFTTGGGALNTSIAFSRLGLKTGAIACIGNDDHAEAILSDLHKERVAFLGKQKEGHTGYSIILTGKEDRTILVYKGLNDSLTSTDILEPLSTRWIYLSTLHGKSFETAKEIAAYARDHKIKTAANISQYVASLGVKKLSSFLKNLDVLMFNREEAELLSRKKDIQQAAKTILQHLQGTLIITDGAKNVHAFTRNQHVIYHIKNLHPKNATGAGDAFAAGVVYALIKNKELKTALSYGTTEARSVLQHIGAHTGLRTSLP
ncbi:MAG: carbohydrate kinase family protein [Nanoarchaeota archaeon]